MYFIIIFSGILFFVGYNLVSVIFRGFGDLVILFYFLIIVIILNIVLDLIFIVVLRMGVEGVVFVIIMV